MLNSLCASSRLLPHRDKASFSLSATLNQPTCDDAPNIFSKKIARDEQMNFPELKHTFGSD